MNWQSRTFRTGVVVCFAAALLAAEYFCGYAQGQPAAGKVIDIGQAADASEEKLLTSILQAEPERLRTNLLAEMGAVAGQRDLTRWYSGQVRIDNQWMTTEEAQQWADSHEGLSEYYKRRSQATDTLSDHRFLIKICKQYDLQALERLHWLHILRLDQNNAASLNKLGLTWHRGLLITREQKEQRVEQEKNEARELKKWRKKAKQLRRRLEQGPSEEHVAAKKELQNIEDPAAVPALLDEFSQLEGEAAKTDEMQATVISTLGHIVAPEAVEALASSAVFSASPVVRYAAINELREKSYEEFLPLLLAELELPIESSVSFQEVGNQVVTSYSLSQEDAAGYSQERHYQDYNPILGPRYIAKDFYKRVSYPRELVREGYWTEPYTRPAYRCGGRIIPERRVPSRWRPPAYRQRPDEYHYQYTNYAEDPTYELRRQQTYRNSQSAATGELSAVEKANFRINEKNQRVAEVLKEVTSESFGRSPKPWWKWWKQYLELHPDIAALGIGADFNNLVEREVSQGLPQGTWIWTQSGKRPVESILPGDYVLSQNVETGELAYKVVLGTQSPRKIEVSRVTLNDTTTHFAPGHTVWVTGLGWRRVSTIDDGHRLHTVDGEPKISSVEKVYDLKAYNLIVDDFHTLFVGDLGILVHDGTHIRKTLKALPGVSTAEIASAAEKANGK